MLENEARKILDRVGTLQFLHILRDDYGLSRDLLAHLLCVGPRTVSRYLAGKYDVDPAKLDNLLAHISDVTIQAG